MPEEIQEAVQIIRVAYDGVEIALKVGSGGIAAMQKVVDLLRGMLDYEKSIGKTSMRKLLLKGGDLQVLQFQTEDMKKASKMAKKYGILYSVLPDINRKDGMSEVIFHTEAVPRANMMIQKLKFGRIATFDDYLKNGNQQDLGKLLDFLKGQKPGKGGDKFSFPGKNHSEAVVAANILMDGLIEKVALFAMEKQSISVEVIKDNFNLEKEQAENVIRQLETIGVLEKRDADGNHQVIMDKEAFGNRLRGYRDLAERMRAVSASKDLNLAEVTLSKTLISKESETAVKTRIPGTWGKDTRFLWVNKNNILDIHNGKTMLTFLDRNKDYKIYDEENRVVSSMKGEELHAKHYDQVEASIRERFEKSQNHNYSRKTVRTATEIKKR